MELQLTASFRVPAIQLFNNWLSSEGHTEMTGGDAEINAEVGAAFTAWDGYISGKNLEIDAPRRIVQSWRTTDFSDNEPDSIIEILFNETDGVTELTLIHTQLPTHGEQYRAGWENHYFQPMQEYFSKED